MNSPQIPEDRNVLDKVWAEFGTSYPRPGPAPAPGKTAPSNDSPAAPRGRQVAGCLILVATVACCDFVLVSRWNALGPAWPVIAYGAIAALGGAAGGFLLASHYPLAGLLAGACSGAGSVCAAAWASGRLVSPDPAIVGVVAFAGLIPGVGGYYPLRWLWGRVARAWAAPADRTPHLTPPFHVIYDPPPDPQAAPLEARLLHLCKEDKRLFDRLLHHERSQHPELRRVEYLRLAIQHFEQDNR